jgi:hypothetical protein
MSDEQPILENATTSDARDEFFELATFAELKVMIDGFNRDCPRPNMDPIQVSDPVVLQSGYLQKIEGRSSSGVYILMTEKSEVLYIGKASGGRRIEQRLREHFDKSGKLKAEKSKWPGLPKHIAVIALPIGHEFEAPAIEEFLILKCGGFHQIGNTGDRAVRCLGKLFGESP